MSPENKINSHEMKSLSTSSYVSLHTVKKDAGSSRGRSYCQKEKYSSGWKILPDLLSNILMGYRGEQEFKMRKYGRYQGRVKVILTTEERYAPRIGTSGSLEVFYMAEPVKEFLMQDGLGDYFDLDNQLLINTIHTIFCSMMLGERKGCCDLLEDSRVRYSLTSYTFSIVGEGPRSEERDLIVEHVRRFFERIKISLYFGKELEK